MALPKLNTPKYKMKLPSTGKVVNYRPFLVKEEKLLLIATETGDQDEIIAAITNIIKECTDLTDINKLPTFDIEYVFLQIRTKSVGEEVEVNVMCPDDGETEVKVAIPLDEIQVQKTRGHKAELKLDENIILTMGYPTLKTFVELNFGDEQDGPQKSREYQKDLPEAQTLSVHFRELPKKQILSLWCCSLAALRPAVPRAHYRYPALLDRGSWMMV